MSTEKLDKCANSFRMKLRGKAITLRNIQYTLKNFERIFMSDHFKSTDVYRDEFGSLKYLLYLSSEASSNYAYKPHLSFLSQIFVFL